MGRRGSDTWEGTRAAHQTAHMTTTRPLTPSDFDDWTRLWTDYLAFYGTSRPAEVFSHTWSRIQDPAAPLHGRIAEADGRAVGIVHFLYHPTFWDAEDRCYLNDLFVEPTARGTGAGRALIEAVYAHASETGAAQVYWLTAEDNATARALYDRLAVKTEFIKYMGPQGS